MTTYDILIKDKAIEEIGRLLGQSYHNHDLFVITDDNVKALYRELMTTVFCSYRLHVVSVKPGESAKSVATYLDVIDRLLDEGIRRDHLIIGFGGGVVTDLAGFVAATLYRGLRYAAVPTSLLAQVDASIGSKTGIDLPRGKNLLGAFKDPEWVVIDPMFLKTLPEPVRIDGISEMVKAALIGDPVLYQMLSSNPEMTTEMIIRAVEVKRTIVTKDPYEQNERMLLNFGHTFGHAIEKKYQYETYSHGVAVAYGMMIALELGVKWGITPRNIHDDVLVLLERIGLVKRPLIKVADVIDHIGSDKKHLSDGLRFIVLEDIGKAVIRTIGKDDLL